MRKIIFMLALIWTFNATASMQVHCLGPGKPKGQMIYLHGTSPLKATDFAYRAALTQLATKLGLKIAAPQSTSPCQKDATKACWGTEEKTSIEQTYANIVKNVSQCLDVKKPFFLIGFSNGGYHIGRIIMRCLSPQPSQAMAIASAGDIRIASSNDLSRCAPLTLLVGTKDLVRQDAIQFATELKALKARVTMESFVGGHDVPFSFLEQWLTIELEKKIISYP